MGREVRQPTLRPSQAQLNDAPWDGVNDSGAGDFGRQGPCESDGTTAAQLANFQYDARPLDLRQQA
jgi:hypothetical protein